jgi:hypothetical protein
MKFQILALKFLLFTLKFLILALKFLKNYPKICPNFLSEGAGQPGYFQSTKSQIGNQTQATQTCVLFFKRKNLFTY